MSRLGTWLESSGFDFVQLLPVNEMEAGQSSPYSAMSAMAIDPVFIALPDVAEFAAMGGEKALGPGQRASLDRVRGSRAVDYAAVRALKSQALEASFAVFQSSHWETRSPRARDLCRFAERQAWWLDEYALFRALHEENGGRFWIEWPREVRDRDPAALAAASERLASRILYFKYLQWLADEQWQRARSGPAPSGIFGDFPFMVSGNSADVWTRQDEFRVDASVGVPPDAFSETGQDWGLPVYRWDTIASGGYAWLRDRVRRCADLYDGFRVDHLVGFYRTFVRERDGRTYFVPADEPDQRRQGEHLMKLFASCGSRILAEDLGTVPDFVRESMAALGIPGMKVFRWEREWEQERKPFRDPRGYPAASVATTGTHDTEPLAEWWDNADDEERSLAAEVPLLRELGCPAEAPFSDRTRDALIAAMLRSGSELVIFPLQDLFGWRDRINTPASVNEHNWTWRLPYPVEDLPFPFSRLP